MGITGLMTPEQIHRARPLFKVTIAYFVLYYMFCFFQSFAKIYLHWTARRDDNGKKPSAKEIKYNSKRGLGLLSDRTFLNMFEQAPPFLCSMWMYGMVSDPKMAAQAGWWYIFFRALYPFLFPFGMPAQWLSTFPCYGIIWILMARTLAKARRGLHEL